MARKTFEEQLAAATDAQLLDLMKNGRIVTDKDGIPICDNKGKPLRKQPTAADFGQALKRLAASGQKLPVAGGAAEEIRKAMDSGELKLAGGGKLHPITEEDVA